MSSNKSYAIYEQMRLAAEYPNFMCRLRKDGVFIELTRDKIRGLSDFWNFCLQNAIPLKIIITKYSEANFRSFWQHISKDFGKDECQHQIMYNKAGKAYQMIYLASSSEN
jgi:hypothetical protein